MDTTTQAPVRAPLVPVTGAFLFGILLGNAVALQPAGVVATGLASACAALWGRRDAASRSRAAASLAWSPIW